jgi:hypothetical protein
MRARGRIRSLVLLASLALVVPLPSGGTAQQVVDRVIARVEDDILTLSELRELENYQRLVEGRADDRATLFRRLLEQWLVENEAGATLFPRPSAARVEQELERLAAQFGDEEAYRARLADAGLTDSAVGRLLERQLYLSAYLDYRFRPAVSIEEADVEAYYREELAPRLAAEGRTAPPLAQVSEQIRELLAEREINERAAEWLEESRARLRLEILDPGLREALRGERRPREEGGR